MRAFSLTRYFGNYDDPNHPGCARVIYDETETTALLRGADAAGGGGAACDGTTDVAWGPLNATIHGNTIIVDFSPKGGPSELTGVQSSDGNAIAWQDGNSWTLDTTPFP